MRKKEFRLLASLILLSSLFVSCGEDRSGEYYALIADKTWIYETMQENYLFYEDLPEEKNIDFFKKPQEFLNSIASGKDKKNGVFFSHVDSINVSRGQSTYPCFGIEGIMVRSQRGDYAIRVLYTQPESPAAESEIKRGDWIIAIDNKKISTDDYVANITRPTQPHTFTLGSFDGEFFDTLRITSPLTPRYIEEKNILKSEVISTGSHKVAYMLYNEFGMEDTQELKDQFAEWSAQSIEHVILDLRYNPGGYVETAKALGTLLAPQSAMGQPFLHMIYNNKINRTDTEIFDPKYLAGGNSLIYDKLYIITSNNTASASEIIINCLKPYLKDRLIQTGTATFGKNVAQQKFTNEQCPELELWLTTCYLSNSEGFKDYYDKGLEPAYEQAEDFSKDLGELGTANDPLLQSVFTHINTGSFPVPNEEDMTTTRTNSTLQIIYNSISQKPHLAKN